MQSLFSFPPCTCTHLEGGSLAGSKGFGVWGFRVLGWGHSDIRHWMPQPGHSSLAHAFLTCSCNHFSFLPCTCTHLEGGSLAGSKGFGVWGFRVLGWGHSDIRHWMPQPGHSSLAHAFLTCSCNHFSFLPCTCTHLEGGSLAGSKGFGVKKNLKWFLNNKVVSIFRYIMASTCMYKRCKPGMYKRLLGRKSETPCSTRVNNIISSESGTCSPQKIAQRLQLPGLETKHTYRQRWQKRCTKHTSWLEQFAT